MPQSAIIYLYRSTKSRGLFGFCLDKAGTELPESLSPWRRFGVIRPTETLPHGLKREAIEPGLRANGYQLYRRKQKPET